MPVLRALAGPAFGWRKYLIQAAHGCSAARSSASFSEPSSTTMTSKSENVCEKTDCNALPMCGTALNTGITTLTSRVTVNSTAPSPEFHPLGGNDAMPDD